MTKDIGLLEIFHISRDTLTDLEKHKSMGRWSNYTLHGKLMCYNLALVSILIISKTKIDKFHYYAI